ncbi:MULTISPECIES: hypothetical protein [unclassified Pseudomonas]|uniref:hypothetical protein n=1 Tax=unclassified Pseudomonas TaxID=196821 RepID=UPI00111C1FC4|nr:MULTISPECIES: hypothetical protein [unclassified Pseudomonas]
MPGLNKTLAAVFLVGVVSANATLTRADVCEDAWKTSSASKTCDLKRMTMQLPESSFDEDRFCLVEASCLTGDTRQENPGAFATRQIYVRSDYTARPYLQQVPNLVNCKGVLKLNRC